MDIPALYVAATEYLLATLSLSHELGHLGGGLFLYFAVLGAVGVRRAGVLPLAAVLVAEGLNETIQALHYGSWRTADTLADIGWTVTLPFLLFAYGALMRPRAIVAPVPARTPAEDRTAIFPV